jgi:hypothetical protein
LQLLTAAANGHFTRSCRLQVRSLHGEIGDFQGFNAGSYIVSTNDVSTFQRERDFGAEGAKSAIIYGGIFSIVRQSAPDERFSRNPCEQRKTQVVKSGEVSQQREIFFESFAKPEPGI